MSNSDLIGKKFGEILVIEALGSRLLNNGSRKNYWKCKCSCGNIKEYCTGDLNSGLKTCKLCKKQTIPIGKEINDWTIMNFEYYHMFPSGQKQAYVSCQCKCGTIEIVNYVSLKNGYSRRCKTHPKLAAGLSAKNKAYRCYKSSAKKRGHIFEITREKFHELVQFNCFYCGNLPSNTIKGTKSNIGYIYNGLDRIDSSFGYTLDNIVTCCANCNRGKLDLTQSGFFDMIKLIYERHKLNEK